MKTRGHRISIAALVSASVALAAATAAADGTVTDGAQYSQQSWDGSEGNTDFGNMHTMLNQTSAFWTGTWDHERTPHASITSLTMFGDFAYLFGSEHQIIYAFGTGSGKMEGSGPPFTYTQDANAGFYIRGSQIASPTITTCDSGSICASVDSSITKTLFDERYPFTIGWVPVTIHVGVSGKVYAGASGKGSGSAFLGHQGSFLGITNSGLSAGAGVSGGLSMEVGIPDFLAFGIDSTFDIVDVSITPYTNNILVTRPSNATIKWNVRTPVNIRTMNGSLYAYVDTFLGRADTDVVSWEGANWGTDLWADSGERSFASN